MDLKLVECIDKVVKSLNTSIKAPLPIAD